MIEKLVAACRNNPRVNLAGLARDLSVSRQHVYSLLEQHAPAGFWENRKKRKADRPRFCHWPKCPFKREPLGMYRRKYHAECAREKSRLYHLRYTRRWQKKRKRSR